MLKKHLVRTGFLSHGLLLFMPNAGTVKGSEPHRTSKEYYLGSLHVRNGNFADTSIHVSTDTAAIPALSLEETIAMPQVTLNANVSTYVKSYMKREAEFLLKMKQRSATYFPLIDSVFSRYGVPAELRYLAIVESKLTTSALSKAGAKGMWQFMPVTAKELGLKITKKGDERTHAYKSTMAAARYLRSLYSEFGDWLLVLAAYNSGPGTVYKAIKKSGSRNYWALQSFLPAETRGHVKRFISIHYYFEGKGSIATQTKAEVLAYKKAMIAYEEKLKEAAPVSDSLNVVVEAVASKNK